MEANILLFFAFRDLYCLYNARFEVFGETEFLLLHRLLYILKIIAVDAEGVGKRQSFVK